MRNSILWILFLLASPLFAESSENTVENSYNEDETWEFSATEEELNEACVSNFRFTAKSTDRLHSLSKNFVLMMQVDGNLVLYKLESKSPRQKWASFTFVPGSEAVMQADGNFVIYGGKKVLWSTGTHGNSGAKLCMQDDGNLVIYKGTKVLWASNTRENYL